MQCKPPGPSRALKLLRRNPPRGGLSLSRRGSLHNNPGQSQERFGPTVPRFLRPLVAPVMSAPVSHVTAFLILHEITAVVPLVGLAVGFHYADWLPPWVAEGEWVRQGIEKFGRYFRRKGWLSEDGSQVLQGKAIWSGDNGVRVVVEVATAWAVTKALLPIRLAVSVWCTPWFARVAVLPVGRATRRIFNRSL
ncbi:hypothetical protein BDY21DRAFT_65877 [Lineolata rhizophorae]|uniref:Uncharacterized protein n=1 Tax=Lineolata rhizophorae TaxID=578093 RepID=A0A6A6NUI5_9PEZI|nr:hypothetical protein BDY21DRAFT_65877 [Lineolata rhizophorae]